MTMIGKILSFSIVTLLLVSTVTVIFPFAYSQSPVINSQWTDTPPTIDGMVIVGEWSNLQLVMREPDYPVEANAYFLNDESNLYVLVDAIEDITEDADDECLLVFDFELQIRVSIQGTSQNQQKSSEDFEAVIGFDSTPNRPEAHKIYEFCIPLSYINLEPGQAIEFCSPFWKSVASIPFDASGGHENDNVWPPEIGLTQEWRTNRTLWGELSSENIAPVGGIITPANKLAILIPYLALVALIGAVISITIRKIRK